MLDKSRPRSRMSIRCGVAAVAGSTPALYLGRLGKPVVFIVVNAVTFVIEEKHPFISISLALGMTPLPPMSGPVAPGALSSGDLSAEAGQRIESASEDRGSPQTKNYPLPRILAQPRRTPLPKSERCAGLLLDQAILANLLIGSRVRRRAIHVHVRAVVHSPILRKPDHQIGSWLKALAGSRVLVAL